MGKVVTMIYDGLTREFLDLNKCTKDPCVLPGLRGVRTVVNPNKMDG